MSQESDRARAEALRGAILHSIPQVRLQFTVLRDECPYQDMPERVFAEEVLAAIAKFEVAAKEPLRSDPQ